jgi:hypothetical protein
MCVMYKWFKITIHTIHTTMDSRSALRAELLKAFARWPYRELTDDEKNRGYTRTILGEIRCGDRVLDDFIDHSASADEERSLAFNARYSAWQETRRKFVYTGTIQSYREYMELERRERCEYELERRTKYEGPACRSVLGASDHWDVVRNRQVATMDADTDGARGAGYNDHSSCIQSSEVAPESDTGGEQDDQPAYMQAFVDAVETRNDALLVSMMLDTPMSDDLFTATLAFMEERDEESDEASPMAEYTVCMPNTHQSITPGECAMCIDGETKELLELQSCKHTFCTWCIKRWLCDPDNVPHPRTCPVCRRDVERDWAGGHVCKSLGQQMESTSLRYEVPCCEWRDMHFKYCISHVPKDGGEHLCLCNRYAHATTQTTDE